MVSLQQIISWFQTGLFPTADQFRQTWLSYWHKSEKIPQSQIFGLQETIEAATRGLIYQNPVTNVADLYTTYPNAKVGWAAMVTSEGYIYSYNGTAWANTGLKEFPEDVATKEEAYKKDTYPYDNSAPFRDDLIIKNVDKWLINLYLDFEYGEGYKYSFSVISKTNNTASLYKHVDGQPTAGNITAIGTFYFTKIDGSRYYLGKMSSQPNSWVIADFDIIAGDISNIYYYDGVGISPQTFKNGGAGRNYDQINNLQMAVSLLEPGANAGEAITGYNVIGTSLASKSECSYQYQSSTFCGWASYIGIIHNFNAIKINIKNNDEAIMTKARLRVKSGGYSGAILADTTLNIVIEPGENKDVVFVFSKIENSVNENIWIEYATDKLSSLFMIPAAKYPYNDNTLWDKVKYTSNTNLNMVFSDVVGTNPAVAAWMEVGYALYQLNNDQIINIESRMPILQEVKLETDLMKGELDQLAESTILFGNEQKWPENNFSNQNAASTFSGWGCHIGIVKNFNAAEICVINRDTSNPITKIRIAIYETDYNGTLLADNTITGISVLPGETKYIAVPLGVTIANDSGKVLFLMYWCDQLVTRRRYNGSYPYVQANGYTADRYSTSGSMTIVAPGSGTTGFPFYFRVGLIERIYQLTDAQINNIAERIGIIPDPTENIEISLPDKIYTVVGDTLQLYFRGMIKDIYPYQYDILVTCAKGQQYPRYFQYTPVASDVGTTTFKVQVKDRNNNILGEKTCQLITRSVVKSPASLVTFLGVGDSLTASGTWCIEASRRLIGTGGTPAGLGLTNIAWKGRIKGSGIGWEGNGGWTWDSYATAGRAAYRFYVSGVVTDPGIGSVYTNNGQTFTVAEINITEGSGYIRCLSSGSPTASGVLTKTSGAGDVTINYSSSQADAGNPFWNVETNQLDFPKYVNTYMDGKCDCIFFLLTWNGQTANRTDFTSMINTAKVLIDHIHSVYPNCKVKIMGIQVPSLNGGMGANYGAGGTGYADTFGMVKTALNMNKAYQDWCNEASYSSFLEFVNVSSQFDSENNMPESDAKVNVRSSKTEKRGTNGVHPNTDGYYQIGDVVFRCVVANYCQ